MLRNERLAQAGNAVFLDDVSAKFAGIAFEALDYGQFRLRSAPAHDFGSRHRCVKAGKLARLAVDWRSGEVRSRLKPVIRPLQRPFWRETDCRDFSKPSASAVNPPVRSRTPRGRFFRHAPPPPFGPFSGSPWRSPAGATIASEEARCCRDRRGDQDGARRDRQRPIASARWVCERAHHRLDQFIVTHS